LNITMHFERLSPTEIATLRDMCNKHPGWKVLEKWMADASVDSAKIPMMHPPEDAREYDMRSGSVQTFHAIATEFKNGVDKEGAERIKPPADSE